MDDKDKAEAKEWFYTTPGMYAPDLAEKYNIPVGQAKNIILAWTNEAQKAKKAASPPAKKSENQQKKEAYWKIAKSQHGKEWHEEYLASGAKCSFEAWRNQTIRNLRDSQFED